ncbi:MAG: universal stress protein, partial [Mailhella sp.]|nr:universal stress protein [Mailhella sp.]
VCALDLAEHSKEVASYATMLAQLSGGSVVALYVAPTMTQYTGFHVPPNSIDTFVSEIVDGAKVTMEQFVKENFAGVNVTFDVVIGYAAEEILACAERENADLIVMGTHGRTGIDRMLFGSVAEKVVKNSSIPVLTIRPTTAAE